MNDLLELSHRIKQHRRALGLTQSQVAEALGVEPKYYSAVENARRMLKLDKLIALCKIFKITLNDLVDLSEYEDKAEYKEQCIKSINEALSKMTASDVGKIRVALESLTL